MKFYLSNEVIYNKIRKFKGEIIDIPPEKINEFKNMGVLGAPIKEMVIETAIIKTVENEMINRNIKKTVKKPVKKGKK